MNSAINLRSGRVFDFASPSASAIAIEDIASALSKLCRFGGHCSSFYSVAEHSYLCAQVAMADYCEPEAILAVLMHDATEAYVSDMVKPLKSLMPEYKAIESRTQSVIAEAFQIDFAKWHGKVSEIDMAMLVAEHRFLFDHGSVLQIDGIEEFRKLAPQFECAHPEVAELRFLETFRFVNTLRQALNYRETLTSVPQGESD